MGEGGWFVGEVSKLLFFCVWFYNFFGIGENIRTLCMHDFLIQMKVFLNQRLDTINSSFTLATINMTCDENKN